MSKRKKKEVEEMTIAELSSLSHTDLVRIIVSESIKTHLLKSRLADQNDKLQWLEAKLKEAQRELAAQQHSEKGAN